MKVICINDKNKPKQIPDEKWIKEGETYTVIFATPLSIQKNKLGYSLKEIQLDESCHPYHYFDSERFAEAFPLDKIKVEEEEADLEIL